jgi:aminomethyltransferase
VPPRSGALIFDAETDGNQIGLVTSGAPSPCVGQPVAMVRVVGEAAIDGPLFAEVRGKRLALERAKMPFVANRFYRGGGKGA